MLHYSAITPVRGIQPHFLILSVLKPRFNIIIYIGIKQLFVIDI